MTDKQQPEALRLAEMLTADEWPGHVTLVSYARECVAELRTQHARITELESQLAQRFDAADMATAAAQGSRDGATAPAQPVAEPANADSVLEDALSDAVRVPLDSLHADAAYLIGRLREGSMPYARVIEIIRERIDAAKAAIRAHAAHGQAPAGANENAELVTLIAECRDAFPIPAHGDPIENYWSAAIEDPANVPAYLQEIAKRKQADSVQEDAARYRWLRDETEWEPFDSVWLIKNDIYGCPTLAMDVAIDAARKQGWRANHEQG